MATRPTPSWLFALTGTPYGASGAFLGIIMPYLAKRSGADLDAISWYVTLLFVPSFLQFTYAPIVDFGPRRKHWLVLLSVIGAIALFAALQLDIHDQTGTFLGVALVAQFATSLVGSCNGGLMATTMTDAQRGKAGGWYNVGNLAGGGLAAALAIYLTGHGYTSETVGGVLALMMVAPALAALTIDEPARATTETTFGQAIVKVWREVGDVLLSRSGLTGALLCLSPVGTAALANYFSAIADEYVRHDLAGTLAAMPVDQAKAFLDEKVADVVAFVTGPVGQILTTIGAVVGGFLC
ncbi:MAG: MFS transporter, partial [Kofleriaceae bacterium]